MHISFYFPFEVEGGAGPASVLADSVASSGTVSSIQLARALRERGHEVEILHLTVERIPEFEGIVLRGFGDVIAACNHLRSLAEGSLVVLPPRDCLQILAGLRDVPLLKFVWLHNNQSVEWLNVAFRLGLTRAVCVTHAASRFYRPFPFFSQVEAIPYSLRGALPATCSRPTAERVVFVGATTVTKGFHHLLRAWPLVRERRPEAVLEVYGAVSLHNPHAATGVSRVLSPDFERQWWNPVAEEMGGAARAGIRFMGAVDRPSLLAAISRATVGVVNPNVSGSTETFCQSAVEMQACGVPCIGGGAGGLLDTISDGRSGFHLRRQRPSELAGRIVQVLSDPQLRGRLSLGALEHAARFSDPAAEAAAFEEAARRAARGLSAPRVDWSLDDALRLVGYGRLKLELKRWLRPDREARKWVSD